MGNVALEVVSEVPNVIHIHNMAGGNLSLVNKTLHCINLTTSTFKCSNVYQNCRVTNGYNNSYEVRDIHS